MFQKHKSIKFKCWKILFFNTPLSMYYTNNTFKKTAMKEKYKVVISIYGALLVGMVLASIFLEAIDLNNLFNIPQEQLSYLLISVAAIIGSELLYKSNMKQLESKTEIGSRAATYQTVSIIRWAVLEGGAFYSMMTPDVPSLNIVIILAYFILICPRYLKYQEIVNPI